MDQSKILLAYRPWLRAVASGMLDLQYRSRYAEDLAQEGWIAMWRGIQEWKEDVAPLDYWLKLRASCRMRNVLRDWQRQRRDLNRTEILSDFEEFDLAEGISTDLEVAYHEGEIWQAISNLTPKQREYVFLKFWKGYNEQELTEHFGYPPGGLWRGAGRQGAMRGGARKRLAADLAHLRPG